MTESSEKSHLKKTVKHSAIYAFGTVIRRLTGFIMLPIYTQYLTPADYGTVALLTMGIDLVSIMVGLRISQALFRYYMLAEEEREKDVIVSTVLLTVIVAGSVGVAILYSASGPFSYVILGNHTYVNELQYFSFTILFSAITSACLSYIRACRKPVLFVSINAVLLALQVLFNIIFVVVMELHVLGVIYSAIASGALIALFLLFYTVAKVGIHFSWEVERKLILFTAPLLLASLGGFFVLYMDKYFLRIFTSLSDVGLYALATRLSSVVAMIFTAFNMTWAAEMYEVVKHENARIIFDQVFRYLSAILFVAGAGVALFAQDIIWILAAPPFYGAGSIVPILVLVVIIRSLAIYNNLGIQLAGRTRHIAEAIWLKTIVALSCFILLIPLLGAYGAAIGLLLGNLAQLRWIYIKSKKLYDMELQWKSVNTVGVVAIIFVLIGIMLPANDVLYSFVRVGLYCTMIYSVYALPVWSDTERKTMQAFVYRYLPAVSRSTN
jgi:O-antigen/teichoic acid export membrane protein